MNQRSDEKAVEALKKGPITPENFEKVIGNKYVAKMLYHLKKFKFEFVYEKNGSRITLITMTKEGKLPPPREKAAPKPVREPGAKRKVNRAFNQFIPKNAEQQKNFRPLDSKDMDDFTIDPDFDKTTLDDVFNSFR